MCHPVVVHPNLGPRRTGVQFRTGLWWDRDVGRGLSYSGRNWEGPIRLEKVVRKGHLGVRAETSGRGGLDTDERDGVFVFVVNVRVDSGLDVISFT